MFWDLLCRLRTRFARRNRLQPVRRSHRPRLECLEDRIQPDAGFEVVLQTGHADIGLAYEDGAWDLHVHDETNDTEYEPGGALLFVGPDAKTVQPAGSQWEFLGAGAGNDLWVLPQNQNPNLLFLGVGTEEVEPGAFASYLETDPRVNATAAWVRLTLRDVRGPGEFSVFQTDAFGNPIVWMSTADNGITDDDSLFISVGSHAHYNWTFTGVGLYEIDVEASAFLDDGLGGLTPTSSGVVTYYFGVETEGDDPPGGSVTTILPPPGGLYLLGQNLDVGVQFDVPVTVTGTPEIDLQIGTQTVTAHYVSGSGTPAITFRYTVTAADHDLDGIALATNEIRLAGGTLLDSSGSPVDRSLPTADLSGARVNGAAPFILAVERLDANPTHAAAVRFQVTFSKAVEDVDAADFHTMLTGSLQDVSVVAVSGSGSVYVVTVLTGNGSGVLGLEVDSTASISDGGGNGLGAGFSGGQVYTLNRRPERVIESFYESGHGDIDIHFHDGEWEFEIHADGLGDFAPDEVLIYGGPEGLLMRPAGSEFDFLGVSAGEPIYIWPQGSSNPDVPQLGIGAEGIDGGTLASYFNNDPRYNASGVWVQLQLADVRGPAGAHLSVYRTGLGGVTVLFATSDGITEADSLYLLEGSHNHFHWAFTHPGIYEVDLIASGFLDANGNGVYDPGIDPYTESGVTTFYFGIDLPGGPQLLTIPADPVLELPPPTPPVIVPTPPLTPPMMPPSVPIVPPVGGRVVHVVDVATGRTRLSVLAAPPRFRGQVRAVVGDLNGDGVPDVVTVVWQRGRRPLVRIFDGATGRLLHGFQPFGRDYLGNVALSLVDVNGDGRQNLILTAMSPTPNRVLVYEAWVRTAQRRRS